jgi:predicted metal-dependent phosphoesterase TrpH
MTALRIQVFTDFYDPRLLQMTTRLIIFSLFLCAFPAAAARVATSNPNTTTLQTKTIERSVHLDAPNASASRYAYVPFDVPLRAVRISISYQYNRAGGANTIDIGLFDVRSSGSDSDQRGFRGWSGGRRSEFFVSHDEATPGYLQGEILQGTWRIILGLYRVAPAGVDVGFKISITTEENGLQSTASLGPKTASSDIINPSNARPTSSFPPIAARPDLHWWGGDLHMHTIHSDGDWTIAELLFSARSLGLDFICITDHNTSSHHLEIDRLSKSSPQPFVMRGEEITTYGGHANAWGLPSGTWIDFRVRPKDNAGITKIAAEVHRAGALISINHPFALCGGCAWSYDAHGFDAIEVWNGEWDETDEKALTMWDKILQSGRRITAIGSSDSHRAANPIGRPTTHVAANVESQRVLLDAIRQGRVYLTSEVARPVLSFEAETMGKPSRRWMVGDEFHLSTPETIRFLVSVQAAAPGATISLVSNGRVLRSLPTTADGRPQVIDVECRGDSYYRLEIRDGAKTMLALTNPIYVKIGRSATD